MKWKLSLTQAVKTLSLKAFEMNWMLLFFFFFFLRIFFSIWVSMFEWSIKYWSRGSCVLRDTDYSWYSILCLAWAERQESICSTLALYMNGCLYECARVHERMVSVSIKVKVNISLTLILTVALNPLPLNHSLVHELCIFVF